MAHQDENEDESPNYFNIESQSESSKEIIASALKSAAKSAAGKGNKSGGAGGKKSRRKSAAGSSTNPQEEKPVTREEKEADNGLSPEEAARQVSLERELTNRYLSGELTFQVFFEPNGKLFLFCRPFALFLDTFPASWNLKNADFLSFCHEF